MMNHLWMIVRAFDKTKFRLANADGGNDISSISYGDERAALAGAVSEANERKLKITTITRTEKELLILLASP